MIGSPIQESPDRRLHAPPRGLSQLVTPFFGARAEPSTRRLSVLCLPGVDLVCVVHGLYTALIFVVPFTREVVPLELHLI